jgi:uncharacterized protein
MMNNALLDANALIAAFDESHSDHERALTFLSGSQKFFTTPQTEGAFLRFFTRGWTDPNGGRQPPRLDTRTAMARLKIIAALPNHEFLSDDMSFTEVSMVSLSGFKQWNDAYLIALARKHSLRLCTLERKLANMDDPSNSVLTLI